MITLVFVENINNGTFFVDGLEIVAQWDGLVAAFQKFSLPAVVMLIDENHPEFDGTRAIRVDIDGFDWNEHKKRVHKFLDDLNKYGLQTIFWSGCPIPEAQGLGSFREYVKKLSRTVEEFVPALQFWRTWNDNLRNGRHCYHGIIEGY